MDERVKRLGEIHPDRTHSLDHGALEGVELAVALGRVGEAGVLGHRGDRGGVGFVKGSCGGWCRGYGCRRDLLWTRASRAPGAVDRATSDVRAEARDNTIDNEI
jgi:hypothetical protein